MKKSIAICMVAAVLAGAAGILFGNMRNSSDSVRSTDDSGHRLVSMWEDYYKAEKADKPKEQSKALRAIIEEARAKRLHWDFYDAGTKLTEVETSRNWKLRDSLSREMESAVAAYDEPIVTFCYRKSTGEANLAEFVLEHKDRLSAARTEAFYSASGSGFSRKFTSALGGLLKKYVRNDYEYALWQEYFSTGYRVKEDSRRKAGEALSECVRGVYPNEAVLEMDKAPSWEDEKDFGTYSAYCEELMGKYAGRAVSLFIEQSMLSDKIKVLDASDRPRSARSDEIKAVCTRLEAIKEESASYKTGADGDIAALVAKNVDECLEKVTAPVLKCLVRSDSIIVLTRNLDAVTVSLADRTDGKSVFVKELDNPCKSLYVFDEYGCAIPSCDDGDYTVNAKSGKSEAKTDYSPRHLSIAGRWTDEGYGVYVADMMSGEPIEKVELKITSRSKSDGVTVTVKDLQIDGFAKLPDGAVKENRVIEASCVSPEGKLLKSRTLYCYGSPEDDSYSHDYDGIIYGKIFTDKSAYNPGETVNFKVLLYEGDMYSSLNVVKAGVPVKVALTDPDGKEAASLSLETNEFGSAAGEFVLPEDRKNGSFRISAESGRNKVTNHILVDEFILPTYDLTFEKSDKVFFKGDSVSVRGKLTSYSGHSLSGARLEYSVTSRSWTQGEARVAEGELAPDSDGSFEVVFASLADVADYALYIVSVKVTDGTGETKEFSKSLTVSGRFSLDIDVENTAEGQVCRNLSEGRESSDVIVASDSSPVIFNVRNSEGKDVQTVIEYSLAAPDGTVRKGSAESGESVEMDFPKSGVYVLEAWSSLRSDSGEEYKAESKVSVIKVGDSDTRLEADFENILKWTGENIQFQYGSGKAPQWVVAELYGDRNNVLERRLLHVEKGELLKVEFEYKASYPDAVGLTLLYFREGKHWSISKSFVREKETLDLPLTIESFEDKALPGKEYSVTLKSLPGVEAVGSVFDASSETLSKNIWTAVRLYESGAEFPYVSVSDGSLGQTIQVRSVSGGDAMPLMLSKAADDAVGSNVRMASSNAVVESVAEDAAEEAISDVAIRSDFSTSLAFEPFMRTDEDGKAELKFRTSDKLSTFVVQVFAHDKNMRNDAVRRTFTVTIPVKVAVVEPEYLYRGDKYVLHGTLSNSSDADVEGIVALQTYSSADYEGTEAYSTQGKKTAVPAGGSVPFEFEVEPSDSELIGLKVAFADSGETFSDGMFVSVPVKEAYQTLTESHSAVWHPGEDKAALEERLKAEFVNTAAYGAEYKEIDIRQMLLDAIPSKVEPAGKDVLSLTEAWYVRRVAESLDASLAEEMSDEELERRILACCNSDGGFGWFEGMKSSEILTAVVLERTAKLRDAGLAVPEFDASAAVKYLDRNQFVHDGSWPYWCGVLSLQQYAYIRSLYASVPFVSETENALDKKEYKENFKEFKKELKTYLLPSAKDGRGMNGQILNKARRVRTLLLLSESDGGTALASAWGIKLSAASKMKKSLKADVESLLEYAVSHRDGGWYFPNAVMPWRGLLESEAYAHSMLADLLSDPSVAGSVDAPSAEAVADGVRLWLMLQKETQQWGNDPAFVDAIATVLSGGAEVLDTKVIALTKSYSRPFAEISSAGNGFTLERKFYRETAGEDGKIERQEIKAGETLHVGDKVVAEYSVWNQENRSFVKLTAPREAGLRPADQLSGRYGWRLRPLSLRGTYSVTPQGYRNVKADCTEYFFDVYPEENSTVTEEFFVTQEGSFSAPVVSIESLYAPHYRANGAFSAPLVAD